MQTLLPLAEKLGARLKERGETIAHRRIVNGRSDIGGAAVCARSIGLFSRRQRHLHRLRAGKLSGHSQPVTAADRTRVH